MQASSFPYRNDLFQSHILHYTVAGHQSACCLITFLSLTPLSIS